MRTDKIYTLNDPRTGLPFYVGKTKKPATRLCIHRNGEAPGTRKAQRIQEIQQAGFNVTLTVWEKCDTSIGPDRERFWVKHFSEIGIELLQTLPGARKGAYPTGKPLPEGHRKAISKALTGKSKSASHIQANAAARKGKPLSPEHRAAISAGHKKDPEKTRERCLKASAAAMAARLKSKGSIE